VLKNAFAARNEAEPGQEMSSKTLGKGEKRKGEQRAIGKTSSVALKGRRQRKRRRLVEEPERRLGEKSRSASRPAGEL